MLGGFQAALLYNAKSVLNQSTFEATRIGAVQHARIAPMQAELARRLAGFYGPTDSAADYHQVFAKAFADIATPVSPGEREGSGTRIRILKPTERPSTISAKTSTAKANCPITTSNAAAPPSARPRRSIFRMPTCSRSKSPTATN